MALMATPRGRTVFGPTFVAEMNRHPVTHQAFNVHVHLDGEGGRGTIVLAYRELQELVDVLRGAIDRLDAERLVTCADQQNHHLYTRCGTCGEIGQTVMSPGGALSRLTIEPYTVGSLFNADELMDGFELVDEREVLVDPASPLGQAMTEARASWAESGGPPDPDDFDEESLKGTPVTE